MREEWRPVKGYEKSHEVSNLGRVRSIYREIVYPNGHVRINHGKVLNIHLDNNRGYYKTNIHYKNKGKTFWMHKIIADAFIPNPDNKPCVNHINGIKTDNRIDNLEWCTQLENMRHAHSNGLIKYFRGPRYLYIKKEKPLKKPRRFNIEQILYIRYLYEEALYSRKKISLLYKCCEDSIYGIISYKTYKDIKKGVKMRSDQALRYIKNFMRECMDCYDKWLWQKNKINEATAELLYYYSRCNEEDREEAWQEIAKHARFSEKVSELLQSQGGSTTLL